MKILFAFLLIVLLAFPVRAEQVDLRIAYGEMEGKEADSTVYVVPLLTWPEAIVDGERHEDVRFDLFALALNEDRSNPVARYTTENNTAKGTMLVGDIGTIFVTGIRAWQMVNGERKESPVYWSDEENSKVYKYAPYVMIRFNWFKPQIMSVGK